MYRYTKNLLPYSFNDNFKKLGNLERSLNYQIDILNTGSLEYLPSYALIKIWNKLPLDLKRSASLGILKKSLFKMLSCGRRDPAASLQQSQEQRRELRNPTLHSLKIRSCDSDR